MKKISSTSTAFSNSFLLLVLFFLLSIFSCKERKVCDKVIGCDKLIIEANDIMHIGQLDSSSIIAKQARLLGKDNGCVKCEAKALLHLGTVYWYMEKLDSARYYYKSSSALTQNILSESELHYKSTSNQALVFASEGKYQEGIDIYESINVPENKEDSVGYLLNLGELYRLQREYRTSYDLFQQSLYIAKEIKDTTNTIRCYNSLALIDQALERHEDMNVLNAKALELINKGEGFPILKASILNNNGLALMNLKKAKAALPFFQESYLITKQLNRLSSAREKKANIAFCYFHLDQLDTALILINEVILDQLKTKDSLHLVESLLMKGRIVSNLGKTKEARSIFLEAQNYNRNRDMNKVVRIHWNLAETEATLGNFTSAYNNMKVYHHGKDSIIGLEVKEKIEELNVLHDKHKADVEILNAKVENKKITNEKNIMYVILVFFLVGILGISLFLYKIRKQNKKIENFSQERKHRFDNQLESLSEFFVIQAIDEKDEDKKQIILEGKLKVDAYAKMHKLIEIDSADISSKDYLESLSSHIVESYNNEGVSLHTEIQDIELDERKLGTIGLVLNETLANCHKYAFNKNIKEPLINISFKKDIVSNEIVLKIIDNGVGLLATENDKESMGLSIMKDLVKYELKGKYEIIENNGTEVKITF